LINTLFIYNVEQ